MNWKYIFSGLVLLASGSFIDNSRGVLLPILTEKFGLSYTQGSGFFIAGNVGAVFATFLLLPLSHRFSEKKLVLSFCLLGILGLFVGRLVFDLKTLILFGVFLGVIISAYSALSNLLIIQGTDLKSRSKMMCGLHMIYGLTSICSPLICNGLISLGLSWAGCLAAVTVLLGAIGSYVAFRIPSVSPIDEGTRPSLKLNRLQLWVVLIFCLYITGEVLNSMWFVTYMVKAKSLSVGLSSRYLSAFFVCMTLTRAFCFVSLGEAQENFLLFICLLTSIVFMILGHLGFLWAFSLSGVLGPFFPLFLGRVSRVFHEQSKVLTLWILGMGYITLGVCHMTVGKLAVWAGIERAYWLPAILILFSMICYGVYLRKERAYLKGLH